MEQTAAVEDDFERLVLAFLDDEASRTDSADWYTDDWLEPPSPPSPEQPWWAPGAATPADDEPSPAVAQLQAAISDLRTVPASDRPVDVAALLTAAEQLRGLSLRGVAAMDASRSFESVGSASTATWVRDTLLVTDTSARAKVRLSTSLRDDLPLVGEQLLDGGSTLEHAAAAVAGTRGLDPSIVRDSDEAICRLIAAADPQGVREQLRDRAEAISPELARDAERRARQRRGFTADELPNGIVFGGGLGVGEGQEFLLGLDLAVEADRTDGDTRSKRQRQADIILTWARRAAAEHGAPAGSVADDLRTTRTQLLLTCTAEQLADARRFIEGIGTPRAGSAAPGSADDVTGGSWPWGARADDDATRIRAGGSFGPGALVSSAVLRRLVCDAAVSLAVMPDAPAGENPLGLRPDATQRRDPLYVGRAARIVTASQWKALVLRDRHCVVKGCRRRPMQCQAHHVKHWADGGVTDLDNLVLLCFQHHHDHHDRGHDLRHRDGRWMTATGWGPQAPP